MDANLLETIQQQLTPSTIQQMSRALGADPKATSNGVATALPVILGGLTRNASNPQGANALNAALDDHDGSILDNLGGLLGGAAASGIGGAILGHVFGSNRGAVEQGVGRASGLNAAQVAQLMAMLAPIVMGVLGRMKQQQGLDANQLPNVLQQTAAQNSGLGGLASVLDSNHDGNIADDVARIGSSVLGGLFKR